MTTRNTGLEDTRGGFGPNPRLAPAGWGYIDPASGYNIRPTAAAAPSGPSAAELAKKKADEELRTKMLKESSSMLEQRTTEFNALSPSDQGVRRKREMIVQNIRNRRTTGDNTSGGLGSYSMLGA